MRRLLAVLVVLIASVAVLSGGAPVGATPASSNPLANLTMGNYDGPRDEVFPAYRAATGTDKSLLGLIANRPRMRWFGAWQSSDQITGIVHEYIDNVTAGRSNVLVQMAVFRLPTSEKDACKRLPTAAEQAAYKVWIDRFAAAIGTTHVAMVLQPDLPHWACAPGHSPVSNQLVAYAAKKFSALAHTNVYIDAGAADWRTVAQAVPMLKQAGVAYARGFALNGTHYDSTTRNIEHGFALSKGLAAAGVPGKHFVINTSNNGRPFTYGQVRGPDFNDAYTCSSPGETRCVALGIPPTTDVTNSRWGLSPYARSLAAQRVDAYLWFGRSWLRDQAGGFVLQRALNMTKYRRY